MKKIYLILIISFGVVLPSFSQCPQANFSSTAPACQGSSINFTNTSGTSGPGWTYFWDFDYPGGGGAAPATSTAANPTGINYTSGGNGVYTVALTITNAGMGCSSTVLIDIDIRTARADFLSSVSNTCVNDSVYIFNSGTLGTSPFATVTHSWSFGLGAIPSTSNAVNPPAVIYTTPGAKTITHFVSVNYGACGGGTRTDLFTQTLTVNPSPTPAFTSNAPQCANSSVNFTNTGSTGGSWTYFWDFGADASPQNSSTENPAGITYSTGGTKTITLTVSNGTCTQTATQPITINALPVANAGTDTTICANTSVLLGNASIAGNSYNWFPSSTLSNQTIANPVASPIAPITTYFVNMTNSVTGCVAQDSVIVTMLPPLIADAGVDVEICRFDSIQIGAGLIEGQTYTWNTSAGLSSITTPNTMASPSTTSTYTLTVSGSGCNPVTDEVTVTVHPLPNASAGSDDTITVGQSTQLIASGGTQYTWSPAYGLSNTGVFNPIANPDTTTTYMVSVIDIYGCFNTDTMIVQVIAPSFWIATAFTPDKNGHNDILFVRGDGINKFEFVVFDRWGEQLFYTKDLKTGWDGTKQGTGRDMPEGAYTYFVKGELSNGDPVTAKGIVNLIR